MIGEERNPTNPQEEDDFEAYLAEDEAQPPAQPVAGTPQPKHWLEEVPENVRERVRQEYENEHRARVDAENRHKAQMGQLQPTQRALEDSRRETKALREQLAKAPKPEDMSAQAWDKFKTEFGEESAAFEGFVNPLRTEVQTLKQQLEETKQFQQEMRLDRARAADVEKVREIHPDLDDIDADPVFGQWLDDAISDDPARQDPVIAQIYAAQGNKFNAQQGAWLITQYKRDLALFNSQAPVAASPKAQAAVARREQQKHTPTTVIKTGQSVSGRSNVTGDPKEDAFAEYLAANPI